MHVYQGVTSKACFTYNKDDLGVTSIPPGLIRTGDTDTIIVGYNANGVFEAADYTGRISEWRVTGDGVTIDEVYFCLESVTVADVDVYYLQLQGSNIYQIQLVLICKLSFRVNYESLDYLVYMFVFG